MVDKNGQLKVKVKKGYREIGIDPGLSGSDRTTTRFMKFGEDGKLHDYLPPEVDKNGKPLKK